MSKTNVPIVKIDTDPAKKSLKDLRKELKDLKDQMVNLEEGSDAFREVAKQAGEVKHQMDEINESVKGASSDFGDLVGNITNTAAGITGAFQAVAGGLQAFGVESEAIDQAIVKMQGLMAVTQGLSAIDDGVKSFGKLTKSINLGSKSLSGFKKALIGTGIGALVVVLGSIIANWDEFTKSIGISEEALEKFGNKAKGVLNSVKEMFSGIGKGITRIFTGDWAGAKEAFKQGFQFQQNFNEGVRKAEEDNTKKKKEEEFKEFEEEYNIRKERINREIKDEQLKNELLLKLEKQRLGYLEKDTLEYEKQLTTIKNIRDEIDEIVRKRIEEDERWKNEINSYRPQVPGVDKSKMSLNKVYNPKEDEEDNIDKALEAGNLIIDQTQQIVSIFAESSLGITTSWIAGLESFQEVFQDTMKIIGEEGEAGWQSYLQVGSKALSGLGQMLNALSNEQDASNEEGFKKTKQLQIAATVMNMLSGIMSAWSSAMSPANAWMTAPGQIAYGTVMSATIAGIGAAQIAKIKSQTMNSANPNTNINAKTTSSMIIPPVQYSAAVQGASTEGAIKDTKVYVTETDITNTINKVSVQERENQY